MFIKYCIPFILLLLISSCAKKQKVNEKNHEETITNEQIRQAFTSEERLNIESVGILLYDGFFDLDAVGPYSVLSSMMGTKVFFVAENKGSVKSSSGLEILVEEQISDVDKLDILLIPGGAAGTVAASRNKVIIDWVQKIHSNTTFTTSVCTGAWILGEAGLLNGKKATTNWYRAEEKLESYDANFVNERWVRDGKIWTSAGVSAGIDMSLALIREVKGDTYTKLAMLNLEYDPQPPIPGGSVEKTNKGLVNHMTQMYDAILSE